MPDSTAQVQDDVRLPLTSADVLGERKERLKELFPEAFVEGQIDFDRLRNALGDFVGEGRERYGLSWAGKADAIRAIQAPSVGTLIPCPDDSVNFDTTENLFIEGDNLEVLKLLQKSYYGKVKMIYIDPPYNTGNEFIYPDNFREGLEDYLKYSGQVSEGGVRLSTNTETSGRYHSTWLDMMYPRLFLARNLLRPDGVMFVSIDDHEYSNLRLLMNEVFGEENFVATFVRKRRMATGMRGEPVSPDHEYIVSFARSRPDAQLFGQQRNQEDYPFEDAVSRYRSTDLTVGMNKEMRPNQFFAIANPRTGKEYWPPDNRVWRFFPATMTREIEGNNIIWPDDQEDRRMARPRYKTRFKPEEADQKTNPVSTWIRLPSEESDDDSSETRTLSGGMNQEATKEVRDLMGSQLFEYPKPLSLLQGLIQLATRDDDIVMDFFAGSSTTAHAVLETNREDSGRRQFIMVQLPEPVDATSTAAREGFATIAELSRERIRRACSTIATDLAESLESQSDDSGTDLGFRAYRLSSSNFKIWNAASDSSSSALEDQLKLFADHGLRDRSEQDVLCELLLKAGLPLTSAVERKMVTRDAVYSIADGLLAICLANPISQECLRGIIELGPQRVICLDAAFGGNDQLKTNTVLEMKSHGIEFRTV